MISVEIHKVNDWMQVRNLSLNLNKFNLIFCLPIANQPITNPRNIIEIDNLYKQVTSKV